MQTLKTTQSAKGKNSPKNDTLPLPQLAPKVDAKETIQSDIQTDEKLNVLRASLTALFLAQSEETIKVKTPAQKLADSIDESVRGLGTWYSCIISESKRPMLMEWLTDQKGRKVKFNAQRLETLLLGGSNGFNLFREYRNEKQILKSKFSKSEIVQIFKRAVLAD